MLTHVCSLLFLLLFAQATATTTTKPADPATLRPADANVVPSIDEARKHLGAPTGEPQIALWISETDPEILFIAVRMDKPRELRASSGGDDLTIRPVGDPKELTYAAASRHPKWREATTNVWVYYKDDQGKHTVVGPKNAKGFPESPVWRGPDAPKAPAEAKQLKGEVRKYEVPSEALGETRRVTVYLPPDFDPSKPLPRTSKGAKPAVIYFADGGVVESMANLIEPMITSGQIRSVVLVGAHTAEKVVRPPNLATPAPSTAPSSGPADPFQNDPRGMEYLTPHEGAYAADSSAAATHIYMFDRHFKFFADELPKWAEKTLGVSDERENRIVSGFSNSAAFVMTLIRQRPMQYGGLVANSMAGGRPPGDKDAPAFKDLPAGATPPKFFLSSGTWEGYFRTNTGGWERYLRKHGAECKRITVVGGHDQAIWEIGLSQALPWMLPPYESRSGGRDVGR